MPAAPTPEHPVKTVLIRADASSTIGSGHVMRCLSLAAALRARGAKVHFASRELPGNLLGYIADRGCIVHALLAPQASFDGGDLAHSAWAGVSLQQDVDDTSAVLQAIGGVDALVVDHYAFDARWQRQLRPWARRIAVIDDLADRVHDADLLLDQGLVADAERRYVGLVPLTCIRLLGPDYAMLRDEFAAARLRAQPRLQLGRLLVFLGGVDAGDHTSLVLDALQQSALRGCEVDVVVGGANPQAARIRERCAQTPQLHFHHAVSNMAELMLAADLSVGAGGSTTWERACLGLPSLILVLADNQRPSAQAMRDGGHAWMLDSDQLTVPALRQQFDAIARDPGRLEPLSRDNLQLVDGRGAERVARRVLAPEVLLRRARLEDMRPVYDWRNDESTRRHSHSDAVIPYADHQRWFGRVLADPQRALLIAEDQGRPVGVLRYDVTQDRALVSIYLVPGCGGAGYGPSILVAGSRWLAAQYPDVDCIIGEVLDANVASHRAFREAGYDFRNQVYEQRLKP